MNRPNNADLMAAVNLMTAANEMTKIMDDFHTHLDQCAQCRNHPFNLCAKGAELLQRVSK